MWKGSNLLDAHIAIYLSEKHFMATCDGQGNNKPFSLERVGSPFLQILTFFFPAFILENSIISYIFLLGSTSKLNINN